jgi:hypothetical protein
MIRQVHNEPSGANSFVVSNGHRSYAFMLSVSSSVKDVA